MQEQRGQEGARGACAGYHPPIARRDLTRRCVIQAPQAPAWLLCGLWLLREGLVVEYGGEHREQYP